jgi:hypothetical protein
VRLAVAALGIGGAVVGAIELLGRNQVADPVPFFLLLPGVLVGALTPDLGAISKLILYGVSVGFYSGLAYLILRVIQRVRKTSRRAR